MTPMLLNSYVYGQTTPPPAGPFIFRIDTNLDGGGTYTLPTVDGGFYDFTVDWGDGNQDAVTAWNDPGISHVYAANGVYDITITGTMTTWSMQDFIGQPNANCITEVLQWGDIGVTNAYKGFDSCVNLTSIPAGFWPDVQYAHYLFANCGLLTSAPTGLFDTNTVCQTYAWAFSYTGIYDLPANLFSSASILDLSAVFSNCTFLQYVPAGTFTGCVNATDIYQMFDGCALLEVPAGLFDDFGAVTIGGYALFNNCTSLTTIPATLFSGMTSVTDLSYSFNLCYALTTIPAGLLDGLTALENVANMFSSTGVTEIPAGLFDDCTELAYLDLAFYSTPLTAIPAGLFDLNPLIASFNATFGYTNITEIPAGLFDYATVATAFAGTFDNCVYLTTVPDNLLDNCPVADLGNLFSNCGSLTTLDASTWDVTNLLFAYDIFLATSLDRDSYDALLTGWGAQAVQTGVYFQAEQCTYTYGGAANAGHDALVAAGWTMIDLGAAITPNSHWKMLDGTGTTAVDSIGGEDGTLNNGAAWLGTGPTVIYDDAVSLDGSNDTVTVPYFAGIPNTGDFTITAWINVTSNGYIFYTGNGSNDEPIALYVSPYSGPGHLVLESYKQSNFNYYAIGNEDLRSTGWRHVAGVRNGSTFSIYIDGVDATASSSGGASTSAATNPIVIGSRTSDLRVTGSIADVRMYDSALPADEINRIFTNQ